MRVGLDATPLLGPRTGVGRYVAGLAEALTPDAIMQLGLAFWGSKTLLSAVELGLFSELANGPLDGETLRVVTTNKAPFSLRRHLATSLGIAVYPDHADNAEDLIARA